MKMKKEERKKKKKKKNERVKGGVLEIVQLVFNVNSTFSKMTRTKKQEKEIRITHE